MAKLTESQKLIRLLQTKFSNKELSSLLGYKGTSQVRKISSGKGNPSKGVLSKIQSLILSEDINTNRRSPRPSEIKTKQKTLRNSTWVTVSRETFLSSFQLIDRFQLEAKLDKLSISNFYFNKSLDSFFISNKPNNNPVTNQVTGFLFEISITKNPGKDDEYIIAQYPIYPIITILDDLPDAFSELQFIILSYIKEVYDAQREDSLSNDLYYSYLGGVDDLNFLAFVSIL